VGVGARGREAMTLYGEREGAVGSVLQIAMPRLPRLYAPGGTMHMAAPFSAEKERLRRDTGVKSLILILVQNPRAFGIKG